MAGPLFYGKSSIITRKVFVNDNYPISIRDNLSSIPYVEGDQKKSMNGFYTRFFGKSFINKPDKEDST